MRHQLRSLLSSHGTGRVHLLKPALLISALLGSVCVCSSAEPLPLEGEIGIHDPSTILFAGGRYWVFGTGQGIISRSSKDLLSWSRGPSVFTDAPDWTAEVSPQSRGRFWAPDVIQVGDRYFLYYSVSSWGSRESAIGLVITQSLSPEESTYGWQDAGIVVRTTSADNFNAIDPSLLKIEDTQLWMAFGSYWSGIKLVQLNPQTGLRLTPDSPVHSIAWHQSIEAASLYARDEHIYLFVNWGQCCRGTNSTYEIRVGRSKSVTGPYLDRDGKDLLSGGGTLVMNSAGSRIGPGHAGLLTRGTKDYLSYHYYDAAERGRAKLGIVSLGWTSDGWPLINGR